MKEYFSGFKTLNEQCGSIHLTVQGKIPAWLEGALVRNGPACFEVGGQSMQHWFDGFAMLHRFSFSAGNVSYCNKFIASQAYLQAMSKQKICFSEFATQPQRNFFQRLRQIIAPTLTDNANVNVAHFNGNYFAMTETAPQILFDPVTLDSLGYCHYDDHIAGQITTAHPHFDYEEQALYNFTIQIGLKCYYHLYRLKAGKNSRELVCSIPVSRPGYLHSFAMTKRYVILVEAPLLLNLKRLLYGKRPFIENYDWQPQRGTRFLIIDKQQGRLAAEIKTDPFFVFHHINSYEFNEKELIVDLSMFADSAIIQALYLKQLKNHDLPLPSCQRFRVDLQQQCIQRELLGDFSLEFPRLYYRRHNGLDYRYFYAAGVVAPQTFPNQLIKVDVHAVTANYWREDHCYPGEPVFVANPQLHQEDAGVLLVVVLNAKAQNSFLLVLDAASFQELARVELPHIVPFGFHGQFWPNARV